LSHTDVKLTWEEPSYDNNIDWFNGKKWTEKELKDIDISKYVVSLYSDKTYL
jgi:hypothetical protein